MSKPQKSFAPTANPDYHHAMVELRRSGASGTHQDRRARRARTRQAAARAAIRRDLAGAA